MSYIIYKTADLARWLEDGNIEFFGRIDNQVKIRGFRMELGEIEARLLSHEAVKEVVVLKTGSKGRDNSLSAWIVSSKELRIHELRDYLAEHLPDFMIPAHFFRVEAIPLTPSGKIDRKRLLARGGKALHLKSIYTAPKTRLEKIVANAWKTVLKREKIGIDDNFFELGGHSLGIVGITTHLRKELKMEIQVSAMFRYRTIRAYANFLSQQEDEWSLKSDRSVALKKGEEMKKKKLQMRKRQRK